MSALTAVLLVCVSGVLCVLAQVRCTDAAREGARLAARGDEGAARVAAARLAPSGAAISFEDRGGAVLVTVRASAVSVLPIELTASASATDEQTW